MRHRELTLKEVQDRLDVLAERRREVGLTEAQRQEYADLSVLETEHLRLRDEPVTRDWVPPCP